MEKNTYSKPFRIPSFLGIVFLFYGLALHGLETKRFDARHRSAHLSFVRQADPFAFLYFATTGGQVQHCPSCKPTDCSDFRRESVSADENQTASLPFHPCRRNTMEFVSTPAFSLRRRIPLLFFHNWRPCSLPLSDPFQDLDAFGPIRPMSFSGSSRIPTWALRFFLSGIPIRSPLYGRSRWAENVIQSNLQES